MYYSGVTSNRPGQVRKLIDDLRDLSEVEPFIMIDEEGGGGSPDCVSWAMSCPVHSSIESGVTVRWSSDTVN